MVKIDPNVIPWKPWTPAQLQSALSGITRPWYVVGGWALDLWHGRQTRDHEDLEFCILRPDFGHFRAALSDYPLFAAKDGRVFTIEDTTQLDDVKQFWGLENGDSWAFDMMIEPGTPELWKYKRGPEWSFPRADMIRHTSTGLPYLAPEAVLLFKAKHLRPKDLQDFDLVLTKLNTSQRVWLKKSLEKYHPNHIWRRKLC